MYSHVKLVLGPNDIRSVVIGACRTKDPGLVILSAYLMLRSMYIPPFEGCPQMDEDAWRAVFSRIICNAIHKCKEVPV